MIKEELKKRNLPELLKFNNGKEVKNKEDWEKRKNEIKNKKYNFKNSNLQNLTHKNLTQTHKAILQDAV